MATVHPSGVPDAAPEDDPSPETNDQWCSVAEAARALDVSVTTVRRRIADGSLTARREPYRQSFRWLVLLPADRTPGATETPSVGIGGVDRLAVAIIRDTDDELRAIAARVDLTRHAVVSVIERERTVALRQAEVLEELADVPTSAVPEASEVPTPDPRPEGSRRALLVALLVCVLAVVSSATLALPAWSAGIVGAFAVIGGLIAAVEAYLVVTAWLSGLGRQRESA